MKTLLTLMVKSSEGKLYRGLLCPPKPLYPLKDHWLKCMFDHSSYNGCPYKIPPGYTDQLAVDYIFAVPKYYSREYVITKLGEEFITQPLTEEQIKEIRQKWVRRGSGYTAGEVIGFVNEGFRKTHKEAI